MITTNEQHEIKPFSFMHTPGFKSWRTAGLNVLKSYYLMSYACKEGRAWITQGMILWCEQDLLAFCVEANKSSSRKIFQISKLIPPKLDGAEIWTTIAVEEIWKNLDDENPDNMLIVLNNRNSPQSRYPGLGSSSNMKKVFAIS